ncbi:short chain dehydrogenase [Musa troglodytarum]|uniref:Short chain dehydrogenase n=1 Tax=Musa troglodytarum TaxID=320322 RepID=A0A9E7L6Z8_9LILI|nr:short chain dehydrogenase [Musa troglodytarum]
MIFDSFGMGDSVKRVLLTSAGDDISKGIAFRLAKAGCRLVLMGDKNQLQKMVGDMASSLKEVNAFKIVGLNMEEDLEAVFDEAVDLAWKLLGTLDAFVNCCAYEDWQLLSALEIGKHKIRVNAVARGLQLDDEYPLAMGKEKAEKSTADIMPLLRWLDPKNDVGSTI